MGSILREQDASVEEIRAILGVLSRRGGDGGLREGQKVRFEVVTERGKQAADHLSLAD